MLAKFTVTGSVGGPRLIHISSMYNRIQTTIHKLHFMLGIMTSKFIHTNLLEQGHTDAGGASRLCGLSARCRPPLYRKMSSFCLPISERVQRNRLIKYCHQNTKTVYLKHATCCSSMIIINMEDVTVQTFCFKRVFDPPV